MRRRGVTVLVGFVLVALLTVLVVHANVPYVQLEPGPTFDTLGKTDDSRDNKDVIVISGMATTQSKGQLRFVTVGVQPELNLLDALKGWLRGDEAVVPRELIYPSDKSEKEIDEENAAEFASSQSSAETAALTELGYARQVQVKEVTKGAPADGRLQANDVIVSVDGAKIISATQLVQLVQGKPVGTTLTFAITRDGAARSVRITTVKGDDGTSRVGVATTEIQPHPFTIAIPVENIGGPSAGLMLALGIIDKIQSTDLTGGKIIAGTGTIDDEGTVGPIGGVPQKLVAAKRDGATIFLTPKDNCAEAVKNAQPGLQLVEVGSLDQALAALDALRAGQQPTLCPGAK